MALVTLFILTTILLFINIEPVRTACIFISIGYLPGFSLLFICKKKTLLYEDLILAFPCSIGLSSALVLGLLSLGIRVNYIPFIIHTIAGVSTILYTLTGKEIKTYADIKIRKQDILFSFFALIVILLLSIPFFLGPNRLAISAHAFHHSSLVTQIINGIFPPENPGLGGTAIGYYWGFHALVAAITVNTSLQQIQIIFLLNVISLYIIFCISYSFAGVYNLSETYRYIMPLSIIGLMRADTGILFLIKLFSGNLMSLKALTASPVEPFYILSYWTSGLHWIDSRLFMLHKLYNVSGMLLVLSLCYAYLLILIKRETYMNKIDIIVVILIISASFINYPPLAIFILFHAPLWSCYIFLSTLGSLKEKIRQASMSAIPYITAGLIVTPYMLYVMASRDMSSGGQGRIFSLAFYSQSIKNMSVFVVPLPLIIYGAWIMLKRLSLSKEFFFLIIGTLLCLILTVFTRWPFDNSYKYNYILILFFSLFFVVALNNLLTLLAVKWLKRLFVTVIIVFLSLTPMIIESSYIVSSFSTDYIYSFFEKHIAYTQDKIKNEAYKWIRENTPHNALILLTYTQTNWPCCGLQSNYEPAAIAERALYVIKDEDYTVSNPEFDKRILFRNKLFEDPDDPSVIDYYATLDRPVYLLLEDDLDKNKFFVDKRFLSFPADSTTEFELVFKNVKQRIYRIRVDN